MASQSGNPDISLQGEDVQLNLNSTPQELKKSLHGSSFQLKLLMLFMLRALNDKNIEIFELGTEMPDEGGKFGDIIFKFKIKNKDGWHCRYVQVKSTLTETKKTGQTATFSDAKSKKSSSGLKRINLNLVEYFLSYLEIKKKLSLQSGSEMHDCVFITNLDIPDEFVNKDFTLKEHESPEKILTFNSSLLPKEKKPKLHKIFKWRNDKFVDIMLNPHMCLLANTLLEDENQNLTRKNKHIKKYHRALLNGIVELKVDAEEHKEKEADATKKKPLKNDTKKKKRRYVFTDNFINNNENLSKGAKCLYQMMMEKRTTRGARDELTTKLKSIEFTVGPDSKVFDKTHDEWKHLEEELPASFDNEDQINDFFEKLVFSLDTPNDIQLDAVLKDEIKNYYSQSRPYYRNDNIDVDFHSDYIFRKMFDWFKQKESRFMLSKEAKEMLEETEEKMNSVVESRKKNNAAQVELKEDVDRITEGVSKLVVEKKNTL